MQVKKFEAPTIQEALENVKRELGPEAIILQTRKNKRGFGLLSKGSVEITAAVSERSLQKKKTVEVKVPEKDKASAKSIPAEKLADIYDRYMDRNLTNASQTKDKVEFSQKSKKITATRYIDIADEGPGGVQNAQRAHKREEVKPQQAEIRKTPANAIPELPQVKAESQPIEEELKYLRRMIEDLRSGRKDTRVETDVSLRNTLLNIPSLQDAFEQLVVNGIDRKYAFALIKKVMFELGPERSKSPELVLDLLASEVMESIKVSPPLATRSSGQTKTEIIAIVGPTGSGKTTTVAKLASLASSRKGLKVGLINFDGSRLGSFEQLGTYARIINAPFRSASALEDLSAALMDFKTLDVVIIDTSGRSQRDTNSLSEMHTALGSIAELKTFLVLPATTKDIELYDAASRFSVFSPKGLIISKLDEASLFGSVYNLALRTKLPLVSFTTGQMIPDDIEDATPERVASLLMEI